MVGTGFLVRGGLGYTAKHVIDAGAGSNVVALFANSEGWLGFPVRQFECHPQHDFAILEIVSPGDSLQSFLRPSPEWVGSNFSLSVVGLSRRCLF